MEREMRVREAWAHLVIEYKSLLSPSSCIFFMWLVVYPKIGLWGCLRSHTVLVLGLITDNESLCIVSVGKCCGEPFSLTQTSATPKEKHQARSQMPSSEMSRKVKRIKTKIKLAFKAEYWGCTEKGPPENPDSSSRMCDVFLAAMTHFCTGTGMINSEQTLLLLCCLPAVSGFLSFNFLWEEMLAHPVQPLPTKQHEWVHRTQSQQRPENPSIYHFSELNAEHHNDLTLHSK